MGKNSNNKKQPKTQFQFQTVKEATHTKNPEGYQNQFIAWHFECMDEDGSWPCNHSILESIKDRLHEYEKRKWSELKHSSHPFPIEKIIRQAQERLSQLGYSDYANLYQLDIRNAGQKQRLWGLRVENIFKILWWDPKHLIYPVQKRGT
jgi:hypothetical protein